VAAGGGAFFRCIIRRMEAERLNAIVRRLADVEGRAAELRRYL
jgi:hypothetical protein